MQLYSLEIFGWLSALCFSLSPVPQVIKSIKDKHANGVSYGLLILWLLGEISAITYILPKRDYPLLANYFLNLVWLSIILCYKFKGAARDQKK